MRLDKYVAIIDGLFEDKQITTFLKICKVLDFSSAKVTNVDSGPEGTVDINERVVGQCPLTRKDKNQTKVNWHNFFRYKIYQAIQNSYKPKAPTMTTNLLVDVLVLKYEEGGFYKKHTDHGYLTPRTLSVIIFLNDDYEGGELEIFSPDEENSQIIKPKRGRIILFPSNFLYPHQAHPVIKGTRYVIVSWLL